MIQHVLESAEVGMHNSINNRTKFETSRISCFAVMTMFHSTYDPLQSTQWCLTCLEKAWDWEIMKKRAIDELSLQPNPWCTAIMCQPKFWGCCSELYSSSHLHPSACLISWVCRKNNASIMTITTRGMWKTADLTSNAELSTMPVNPPASHRDGHEQVMNHVNQSSWMFTESSWAMDL